MRRVDQLKARLRAGKDVDWATIGDPVANLRTGSLTWKKGRFIEIFEELLDANGRECGFYHSFTGGWFKDFCVARCDFNGLTVDYEREKDVGRLIHKGDCVGRLIICEPKY